MKFLLVIPTYNEAENIGVLIEKLSVIFKTIPEHTFEILVVDGNSPDGTGDVVLEKAKKYDFVHLLLEKEKAGLGAAYIYAFKYAMEQLNPDAIVQMDGDNQHNPQDFTKLVRAIEEGNDLVIGSRYIDGGSIPKEWAFYRKFLSYVGNWVAKLILGMFTVNDFTTGYRALRVKGYLDTIDLDNIISTGYSYCMDMLFQFHKLGAKIAEVPITFGVRDRGDSKMERDNALESLKVVIQLRIRENQSFFRFCVVGFIGFFTDMILANIFRLTPLRPNVAASSSALIATFATYYFNNNWSFAERKIKSLAENLKSMVIYFIFSSAPIFFRFWFVGIVASKYGKALIPYNGAILVSIVVGLVWNFVVYSKIIWRKK